MNSPKSARIRRADAELLRWGLPGRELRQRCRHGGPYSEYCFSGYPFATWFAEQPEGHTHTFFCGTSALTHIQRTNKGLNLFRCYMSVDFPTTEPKPALLQQLFFPTSKNSSTVPKPWLGGAGRRSVTFFSSTTPVYYPVLLTLRKNLPVLLICLASRETRSMVFSVEGHLKSMKLLARHEYARVVVITGDAVWPLWKFGKGTTGHSRPLGWCL